MATQIIAKKSSVADNPPAVTDLVVGELAVNLADKKIYTKDGNNTIITLGDTETSRIPIKADEAISKGNVVYATGAVGNSGKISVSKFIANNTIDELYVLGVAETDMASGDIGFVLTNGEIKEIATNGAAQGETWVDGTVLYASPTTAGQLTSVEPISPNQEISVAIVLNSHATNGQLFVRPTAGFHLKELHDVYTPSPTDGQVLSWNNTNSRWEAATPSSGGGGVTYTVKTANYTAVSGDGIIADTSGGTWTLTLPATPSAGDSVIVLDGADWSTTNLTVGRNGSTIEGDAEDMLMNIGGASATFLYDGTTWQVYVQVGVVGDAVTLDGTQTLTNKTLDASTIIGTMSFGDNVSATFGDSSDLLIYHDGDNSVIDDQGTGNLRIKSSFGTLQTQAGVGVATWTLDSFRFLTAVRETIFSLSGTSIALDAANGTVQTHILTGNTIYTDSIVSGEYITLMINDGSARTVTWPSVTWVNNGGVAPTLSTTGYTVVALWKVASTLYGALVGDGT